jgi:membrane-associated phospholipid phosphatase
LAGVAHIVHAGDIGRPDVIAGLRRIAPVIALRGNVDIGSWAQRYPGTRMVRLSGRSIYVLHDIHELKLDSISSGIDVVIPGYSDRDDSGRALSQSRQRGPRRFNLPVTLAILELTKSGLRPFIHHLDTANTD